LGVGQGILIRLLFVGGLGLVGCRRIRPEWSLLLALLLFLRGDRRDE